MSLLEKLANGRVANAELSDEEIREAYSLQEKGAVEEALFDRTPEGELISLHTYWFLPGEKRNMNGQLKLGD